MILKIGNSPDTSKVITSRIPLFFNFFLMGMYLIPYIYEHFYLFNEIA